MNKVGRLAGAWFLASTCIFVAAEFVGDFVGVGESTHVYFLYAIPLGLIIYWLTIDRRPPLPEAQQDKLSKERLSQMIQTEEEFPSETAVEDENPDDGDAFDR